MISVTIRINGRVIGEKHAIRNMEPDKRNIAQYGTDCGKIIKHNPKDGAVELAKKMLNLMEVEKISKPDYNICRRCKHKGNCEGYFELIHCIYNYPNRKFEEVKR